VLEPVRGDDVHGELARIVSRYFLAQVPPAEFAEARSAGLPAGRSGGRSAMAVNLMAKEGFTNVYNIIDGMEGDMIKDPENAYHGKRMKNGWKNSGNPWTYQINPEQVKLSDK